jgi:hypothetical protein
MRPTRGLALLAVVLLAAVVASNAQLHTGFKDCRKARF